MNDARRPVLQLALFALLLRLLLLFVRGDYIVFDEGYYLLLARSLRAGHGFSLNGLPHVALSPLQPLMVAGLSFTGIPDLWASRLLAAVCGAGLVIPVAVLAYRWFGCRGSVLAAAVTASFPALLTYLPFFPGHGWNLYFGSEPLFLLLATSAIALAARAFDTGKLRLWFVAGALADLSYCTRLEGIVLSVALGLTIVAAFLVMKRPGLGRAILSYSSSAVLTIPYLLYLHGALGKWAVSGRVQAAASAASTEAIAAPPTAPAGAPAAGGSDAVNNFVWGGDVESLWRTLYALDASGTQMSSQYWGIPARPVEAPRAPIVADSTVPRSPVPPSRTLLRALLVVLPFWIIPFALFGIRQGRPRAEMAVWLMPAIVTGLLPAILAYAEPRALLMLVPATCILTGGAMAGVAEAIESRTTSAWPRRLTTAAFLCLLLWPTARDLARSWHQETPLQRVATARRVLGEYLGRHVAAGERIVAWHPASAIWARREWRVLPYEPMERIVRYAQAQGAGTVVFSRFDPSPLRQPPRAFTVMLLDASSAAAGTNLHLEQVDATPLFFVGRLTPAPTQ